MTSIFEAEKVTELTERQPTINDVRRGCRRGGFEYLDIYDPNVEVLYAIPAGDGWAMVIGDRNNGDYEWCYVDCSGKSYIDRPHEPRLELDEAWEHSNQGYGGASSALRDVLIHVEGLACGKCGCWMPAEEHEIRCHRC